MRCARIAVAFVALTASACEPDRAPQLRKELEQLKTERVERVAVEKAKAELTEVEARLDSARAANAAKAASLGDLEKKRDGLHRAAAMERERTAHAEADQVQAVEQTQQAVEATQKLDQRIARAQARALWARDQIANFAREIRDGDPAWATERRLASLRDLLSRIQKEWAGDPILASAAAELGATAVPARAREIASQLDARFTQIYELPGRDVAAGVPAR